MRTSLTSRFPNNRRAVCPACGDGPVDATIPDTINIDKAIVLWRCADCGTTYAPGDPVVAEHSLAKYGLWCTYVDSLSLRLESPRGQCHLCHRHINDGEVMAAGCMCEECAREIFPAAAVDREMERRVSLTVVADRHSTTARFESAYDLPEGAEPADPYLRNLYQMARAARYTHDEAVDYAVTKAMARMAERSGLRLTERMAA